VYHAILAAIAGGARKFGEISSKVGLDRPNLSRYLATLSDLDLVVREVPVTEQRPDKSRKGLYRIVDPFVAVWFAFVDPYRDLLERGLVEPVMRQHVKPNLSTYLGQAVEPVLTELLCHPPLSEKVPFHPIHAGHYWSPTAEFDVVLLDVERQQAFVAEVKWGQTKIDPRLLGRLRRKVSCESAFGDMKVTFALISRAGFGPGRGLKPDERLIDVSTLNLMGSSRS